MPVTNLVRYAVAGIVFGACFPVGATLLDASVRFGLAWSDLLLAQRTQPLHWIIDTAPLWLGLFASAAGVRQDRVEALVHDLRIEVDAARRARQAALDAEDVALVASAAKSEFLANMSHELRTPLNAIIGYSEMLLEGADAHADPQTGSDLRKVRDAGRHLLAVIDDLLDLSKIEAGQVVLTEEPVDLEPLLRSIAATASVLMSVNANSLELRLADDLATVDGDAMRLRQVLLNLIGNAAKFTQAGRVVLSADIEADAGGKPWLVLAVSDTGIGMTSEQLSRLFRPFAQADATTTRRYGGTGLGLALSKRFCHLMGGSLSVESEPGVGSTFTVRLPVRRGALRTPLPPDPSGPRRVLVIDDDATARELMQRLLAVAECEVRLAVSGHEGVEIVRTWRPDVITLDVAMPGADGWTVLAQLKNDPSTRSIPVVMLTMVDDRARGLALGASEYLLKPVDRAQLLALIRRFGQSGLGDALVVEDDPAIRELVTRTLRGAGWGVHAAEDGRAALDLLPSIRPDVILLDLTMPRMDGFELLGHLRSDPRWWSVPVVVLTARTLDEGERAVLDASVARVLRKGALDRVDLLAELDTALGRPGRVATGGQPVSARSNSA